MKEITIFQDASAKMEKCDNSEKFYYIGYCRLFHYTFDTSADALHYCANCTANTDNPTTFKKYVRRS